MIRPTLKYCLNRKDHRGLELKHVRSRHCPRECRNNYSKRQVYCRSMRPTYSWGTSWIQVKAIDLTDLLYWSISSLLLSLKLIESRSWVITAYPHHALSAKIKDDTQESLLRPWLVKDAKPRFVIRTSKRYLVHF